MAEAKATTADPRGPASMPENEMLASFVRSLELRTLLNTIKHLSDCQDPQERGILQGLANQLRRQVGMKRAIRVPTSKDMASCSRREFGGKVRMRRRWMRERMWIREGDEKRVDFWANYPNINASCGNMKANIPSLVALVAGMSLLKERLSLIGNVKVKELDDKWKQLFVEESKLSCMILMLMKEHCSNGFGSVIWLEMAKLVQFLCLNLYLFEVECDALF
ncbi:uncharacterized protein LOC125215288 [Salvia hispanica]|uniref:uncharacterized protein LOC125215288 n=1 Tax=Salvia hispanica TaxID=49212 RepID=UPI0020095A45|nr:uncharacterized protein LOC125215288 [Salvia hispanica]